MRQVRRRAAAEVQRLAGRRLVGPLLSRVAPARFGSRPARAAAADTVSLAARPVQFPQLGRGSMRVATLPDPTSGRFAPFARAARRSFDVAVTTEALRAPHAREALLSLCASGAALRVVGGPADLAGLVGPDLADLLIHATPAGQYDRERRSVALRRAALMVASPEPPAVSVLLASRRPDDVGAAIRQVGAQAGCVLQIVVGLHGDQWPASTEQALADIVGGTGGSHLDVARYPADMSLGAMLAAMTQRCDAAIVTKWDDDDWYGPDHVRDLALAHGYSGADVVGKAAEFVYLESADTTIRRMAVGAESYSSTVAGGTLLASRAWLDEIGGWPDVRTAVDRQLLAASDRAGGSTYRTHGFQYVLRRRADANHTWATDENYFLAAASDRRPGLDLAFADIGDLLES